MRIFSSELFGKIEEPESFQELIDVILRSPKKSIKNVKYWRGQSNINWRIDSSGYRRLLNTKMYSDNIDYYLRNYETKLLDQATHKGYRYYNGRELYDFELLGRLQHHGAATRLVDFSRNALIALWFCVNENKSTTGLLLGISTYNTPLVGHENELRREDYNSVIDECEKDGIIYNWEPPNISARMAAQHSQFLFSKVSNNISGSLILSDDKSATVFIAISPKMKQKFKIILEETFDIRTLTMFPDIDGFGLSNNQNLSRWDMDRW